MDELKMDEMNGKTSTVKKRVKSEKTGKLSARIDANRILARYLRVSLRNLITDILTLRDIKL